MEREGVRRVGCIVVFFCWDGMGWTDWRDERSKEDGRKRGMGRKGVG